MLRWVIPLSHLWACPAFWSKQDVFWLHPRIQESLQIIFKALYYEKAAISRLVGFQRRRNNWSSGCILTKPKIIENKKVMHGISLFRAFILSKYWTFPCTNRLRALSIPHILTPGTFWDFSSCSLPGFKTLLLWRVTIWWTTPLKNSRITCETWPAFWWKQMYLSPQIQENARPQNTVNAVIFAWYYKWFRVWSQHKNIF